MADTTGRRKLQIDLKSAGVDPILDPTQIDKQIRRSEGDMSATPAGGAGLTVPYVPRSKGPAVSQPQTAVLQDDARAVQPGDPEPMGAYTARPRGRGLTIPTKGQ